MEKLPDGTVKVTFYAHHNHTVQQEYAARFVNPLVDGTIRHMVDCKLLAGVTNTGKIAADIRAELMIDKKGPLPFDELRLFHLCNALDHKHVLNRRNELLLNSRSDFRMDDDDTKSVWKLIQHWTKCESIDSPVRYYKPVGEANADTCETIPKGKDKPLFSKNDFLLVLQSLEQALMMKENSRVVCVDGTHGMTGYDYTLLSLVVVDRFGKGLVVGYGVTSTENHFTWELTARHFRPEALQARPEV